VKIKTPANTPESLLPVHKMLKLVLLGRQGGRAKAKNLLDLCIFGAISLENQRLAKIGYVESLLRHHFFSSIT
jgi:hypothetical protein